LDFYRLALKLAVSLVLSVLAFCAAFLLTGAYYNHFVVAELVKKYPHDGQIGLGGFMGAINIGFVSAVVVLVIGILWSFRSAKRA
jgi:predicted membrane protein